MSESEVMIKHLLTIEKSLESKIKALEAKIEHDVLREYLNLEKKIYAKIQASLTKKFKTLAELELYHSDIKKDNIYLGELESKVKNRSKWLLKWYDEKNELEWELSVIRRKRSSYEYWNT